MNMRMGHAHAFRILVLAALVATAPGQAAEPGEASTQAVDAKEVSDVRLEGLVELGYVDERGRHVVDVIQNDHTYLAVRVETPDGRPVQGAAPVIRIDGTSQLLTSGDPSSQSLTDGFGILEFVVIGGRMGLDRISVEYGGASAEILLNVISLEAAGFPAPPAVEGGLPWDLLMRARIRYQNMTLLADFPQAVAERSGQLVKLSGFIMPLEPDLRQRRFLLTSNPPSCFFHVPGGPAGAVEVFAAAGIELSWNPIVLEGRFEAQHASEIGVVYRLHDARLITP